MWLAVVGPKSASERSRMQLGERSRAGSLAICDVNATFRSPFQPVRRCRKRISLRLRYRTAAPLEVRNKACKDAWHLNGNCFATCCSRNFSLVASSARHVLNTASKRDGSNRQQRAVVLSSRAPRPKRPTIRHALRKRSGLVFSRATIPFASRSS